MRITTRLQLIKYTVLIGLLCSVALCYNLWCGQRWFPKAPLIEGLNLSTPPYDYINVIVLGILCIISLLYDHKWSTILLLLFAAYLVCDDQNRLQPWFYNYLVILLVLLFYRKRVDDPNNYITVFISLQLMVALIYIYSGVQKLNPFFVGDTFTWFIEPLKNYVSGRQLENLGKLGFLVPYVEIGIGLCLLIKPFRFIALPMAVLMHVFILCMLGPLGRSYNYVVWPWNIVMILLCLLLYSGNTSERFFSFTWLLRSGGFYVVLVLMLIMPFLSLGNKWPSYLSSSLYSGNTNSCHLILSDKAYNKLPFYIRSFVTPNANYNVLSVSYWCMMELKTPCYPEKDVYQRTRSYVQTLTSSDSTDVKIEFKERKKLLGF